MSNIGSKIVFFIIALLLTVFLFPGCQAPLENGANDSDVDETLGDAINTSNTPETLSSEQQELLERANIILPFLKNKELGELAQCVHKDKGVTFSPYAYIEENAVKFTVAKLRTLKPTDKFIWSTATPSGLPFNESISNYFKDCVYSRDFIQAPQISVDKLTTHGGSLSNIETVFPAAHFVEYYFPATEGEGVGLDWAILRLVFENVDGQWMLVAIINDTWVP
ncbi:MAG: hypothetical protein FWF88_12955 [Peptococcaceae bacterium]|nr:hypothetical protein [Peptococcaceae bacterium]